jgi:septal ring factor EnvC (AmiA/AmiB activator)
LRLAIADIIIDLEPHPRVINLMASIDTLYFRFHAVLKQAKILSLDLETEMHRFFKDIRQQVEKYHNFSKEIFEAQDDLEKLNKNLKNYPFFAKEVEQNKSNYQLFLEDIIEYL